MTSPIPPPPPWLKAARKQWIWRGRARPLFASNPRPGQTSVWDFPRPPRLAPEPREVRIVWGGVPVACSTRAVRMLETAHPPTYYIPWADIARHLLQPAPGGSFCEWKGTARYWSLVDGDRQLPSHAWSYPQPLAGAEELAACVAFYAHDLACSVGGLPATPQPGGFTAAGSRPTWRGLSRVKRAAKTGKGGRQPPSHRSKGSFVVPLRTHAFGHQPTVVTGSFLATRLVDAAREGITNLSAELGPKEAGTYGWAAIGAIATQCRA